MSWQNPVMPTAPSYFRLLFACFFFLLLFLLAQCSVSCVWQLARDQTGIRPDFPSLLAGSFWPCLYTRPLYYSFLCLLLFVIFFFSEKKVCTHLSYSFFFLRLAGLHTHAVGTPASNSRTDPNIASSWPSKCKIKIRACPRVSVEHLRRREWNRDQVYLWKQGPANHHLAETTALPTQDFLTHFTPYTTARWKCSTCLCFKSSFALIRIDLLLKVGAYLSSSSSYGGV